MINKAIYYYSLGKVANRLNTKFAELSKFSEMLNSNILYKLNARICRGINHMAYNPISDIISNELNSIQ